MTRDHALDSPTRKSDGRSPLQTQEGEMFSATEPTSEEARRVQPSTVENYIAHFTVQNCLVHSSHFNRALSEMSFRRRGMAESNAYVG
jgi:hypothetical protein